MPLKIVRNDITKMECDAIVNAANSTLLGGGGVDGAIHRAAGSGLLAECRTLGGCDEGEAKITGGYSLPAKYVIHTVGPVWSGGNNNEEKILRSCYRKSLKLALKNRCESVAFPLISAGAYGYPKEEALDVAVSEISAFLMHNEMLVYIVVFDKTSFLISESLLTDVREYINDRYVDENIVRRTSLNMPLYKRTSEPTESVCDCVLPASPAPCYSYQPLGGIEKKKRIRTSKNTSTEGAASSLSLDEMIKQLDESFSQMLLRKIDERNMKDSDCYKKANIDRKLFSKIKSDVHYKPSKPTVIAFAIALELSLNETQEMLRKAGFALSHSSKFDIIIEYFISNGIYDIFRINETLFALDQNIL